MSFPPSPSQEMTDVTIMASSFAKVKQHVVEAKKENKKLKRRISNMNSQLEKEKSDKQKLSKKNDALTKTLKGTRSELARWRSRYLDLANMSVEERIESQKVALSDKGFD